MTERPLIIGAGIGGLCSALNLALTGYRPIILEKNDRIGGKMVPVTVDSARVDGGPTVLTMTWVFEELFARAGDHTCPRVHDKLAVLGEETGTGPGRLSLNLDVLAID